MVVKIKDGVDLEELRKFGFKTGKEWWDAGERCMDERGNGYNQQNSYHKFLMDPDDGKIFYSCEGYDDPVIQITVRVDKRDIYIACNPSYSDSIEGRDLFIIIETIFDLTQAGLLEVVHE